MTATLQLREETYKVSSGMTVRAAMKKVGIQPESVIPTRDGDLITEEEILKDGDHIRLVAVISGGD